MYFLYINNPAPEFYIVGQEISVVTQWEPQIKFRQQKNILPEIVAKLWRAFLISLSPSVHLSVRPSSFLKIESCGTDFLYVIMGRYTKICLAT